PGFSQLRGHDKGEFVFTVPGFDMKSLEPAPPLNKRNNPYRGLEAFDEAHAELFFGRQKIIDSLTAFVETHPLTVVLGASGSGKSSLVKAGLLPELREQGNWTVLTPMRPGQDPFCSFNLTLLGDRGQAVDMASREAGSVALQLRLEELQRTYREHHRKGRRSPEADGEEPKVPKVLLIIDQCEELVTLTEEQDKAAVNDTSLTMPDPQGSVKAQFLETIQKLLADWPDYFRVILTLRSDFEPQFLESPLSPVWSDGRFVVPVMGRADLRAAILEPAAARAIYFDPPSLVDRLIDEVAQTSGSLPLLSFALSELYLAFLKASRAGERSDRAITLGDYETIGGVASSLARRADAECDGLIDEDPLYNHTLRHVLLRMVTTGGGTELAKRRVNVAELDYEDAGARDRIDEILARFVQARLFVQGTELDGSSYVEPAHDALILGWQRLRTWQQENREQTLLQRLLLPALREWKQNQYSKRFLWSKNPRLPLLRQSLKAASGERWLNRQEAKFARDSARRNSTLRRWAITGGVTLVSSLVFGLVAMVAGQQRTALQQKSADAELTLRTDTARGVIQAVEVLNDARSPWIIWDWGSQIPAQRSLLYAAQAPLELRRSELTGHSLVSSFAFSAYGDLAATGLPDGSIRVWNNHGRALNWPIHAHDSQVIELAFYGKRNRLASLGLDGLRLWTRKGESLTRQPIPFATLPVSLAISPDGRYGAISTQSDTIEIWDLDTVQRVRTLSDAPVAASAMDFFQGENGEDYFAAASEKSPVVVWSFMDNQRVVLPNIADGSGIRSLAFSPSGCYLAGGSYNGTVTLWKHKTGKAEATLQLHYSPVTSLRFDAQGRFLTSGSGEGTIQVWDLRERKTLPPRYSHEGAVLDTVFSRGGNLLMSGGRDGALNVWDMDTPPLGREWSTYPAPVSAEESKGELEACPDLMNLAPETLSVAIQPPVSDPSGRWISVRP
ncbi:MAG: WD40 repeat domain-containing protein, partial [Cyanobacteria bacterium P01_H01_bin.130]